VCYEFSHERGSKLGYFAICLSKLRKILGEKGYKVSEAQIRLIMKDLSNIDGFEEMEFSRQKKIFMSVVSKYVRVSRHAMELAFCQAVASYKCRKILWKSKSSAFGGDSFHLS